MDLDERSQFRAPERPRPIEGRSAVLPIADSHIRPRLQEQVRECRIFPLNCDVERCLSVRWRKAIYRLSVPHQLLDIVVNAQ
jgi:hypothetical protein